MQKVKLLSYSKDYRDTLPYAISKCYQSKPSMKAVEHCIKSGHLSVLEHCMATFEITCSIQTLLQITRHRHLSFTVQSSRGSQLKPWLVTGDPQIDEVLMDHMKDYVRLLEEGKSYEEVAYVLPKGAMYNLVVSGNLRAWFEYLPKRLCKRAQKEHREIALEISHALGKAMPEIFNRPLMNCSKCTETKCTFHGKEK